MNKIRLLAITNIISPYRIAFFNEIMGHPDIDLHVAYVAETEANRAWSVKKSLIRYPYTILPGMHLNISREKTLHLSWRVASLFDEFRPDVLFLGTDMLGSTASWRAWWLARRRRIPIIRYEARHRYSASSNKIKNFIYGYFIRHMDSYFVYSRMTKEYLIHKHGISPAKIEVGFNVGDSRFFIDKVKSIRESPDYLTERSRYPRVMLLFAGQLDERKNVLSLLAACQAMEDLVQCEVGLFIAGDGPHRDRVRVEAGKLQKIKVYLLGFLQSEALAAYFAYSDIFVLPCLSDPASIVLSEALHSGLFVIGSNRDGSSENFIEEGRNGYIVDPENLDVIARRILSAITLISAEELDRRKARIAQTMSDFTVESYAARLVALARNTYAQRMTGRDKCSVRL